MPFNENWRSRRKDPVTRPPDRADPAAAALGRAIMLARALKWREEWQAEMAARRAKANGSAGKSRPPRSAKPNGDAQFAAAVARNEFGRFYRNAAHAEAPPKKSRATSKRKGGNK